MALVMHVCALVVRVLTLPLQILEAVGLFKFYKRIFPVVMFKFTVSYNAKMKEKKRELFRSLTQFSPEHGPLRLLEVGCGSGANFENYPPGCRIICTDPNPHFQQYLQKSMQTSDHLVYDSFVVASGEDLSSVGENSVDVVVCTLVLCSVSNTAKVLQEVKRVLRPGGAFFFLEHVVADSSSWTYFFQHVLQPFWYYFGDGCEVTRATWKHLEDAGFSELQLSHIQTPLFFILRPHIMGYAVK
ncbi:thiol S-methyltransferase TMT1A-like [Trichomycterus rosablanca]|uniref:thiol S-methyltransferase TMT1A-like n=1 Tax=Trichomycterus rosablanca TaxID=2290929 RepID=UPI002F355A51